MKNFNIFRYGIMKYTRKGIRLSISLTYRCNLKCSYCSINFPNDAPPECKESTLKELKEFVLKFPLRIREIQLSGGSPEMHPDFVEFTNWLLDKGYFVQVVTNLTHFNKLIRLKRTFRLMLCSTFHHCYNKNNFISIYFSIRHFYRVIVEEIGDRQLTFSKVKAYIKPEDMVENIKMLRVSPDLKIYCNCYDLYKK